MGEEALIQNTCAPYEPQIGNFFLFLNKRTPDFQQFFQKKQVHLAKKKQIQQLAHGSLGPGGLEVKDGLQVLRLSTSFLARCAFVLRKGKVVFFFNCIFLTFFGPGWVVLRMNWCMVRNFMIHLRAYDIRHDYGESLRETFPERACESKLHRV